MKKHIDTQPTNHKGQLHGYCEIYWSIDEPMYKYFMVNGKRVGYEEDYVHYGSDGKVSHLHLTFHL